MRLALLALALVACVGADRVGSSRWTLSDARCTWIHRDGDPHHAAWVAATTAAEGVRSEPTVRAEVCAWGDGPRDGAHGRSRLTGGTCTIAMRSDLDAAATERLVVHELMHCLGGDLRHADPRWWRPARESAELRATCALQPGHAGCAP